MTSKVSHTNPLLEIVTRDFNSAKNIAAELTSLGLTNIVVSEPSNQLNSKFLFKYPGILSVDFIKRHGSQNIVNLHNGKLPEYRGLHALSWMIQNGENTGYLTLHRVEQGIDSGPIIAEFKFEISKKMDVNDAREQINSAIINWLPQQIRDWIGHKERYLRIQNNNLAKVYPRKKDQNLCTVNSRVEDVLNLIRAVNPPFGPGAIYQNGSDLMRICLNYGPSSSEFISRHDMREVNIQLLDGQLKVLNF